MLRTVALGFENVYRVALQAADESPIAYAIFLQNILWLCDELNSLSKLLSTQ